MSRNQLFGLLAACLALLITMPAIAFTSPRVNPAHYRHGHHGHRNHWRGHHVRPHRPHGRHRHGPRWRGHRRQGQHWNRPQGRGHHQHGGRHNRHDARDRGPRRHHRGWHPSTPYVYPPYVYLPGFNLHFVLPLQRW